jgi:UDP-glucose 4-epimerase
MRVLVTGGAGFIGSHVADALLERGHAVWVLDDLSTGSARNVHDQVTFIEGDIRDPDVVERAFRDARPEVVNHQAAQTSVSVSVREPVRDADVNVLGSLHLLEACVRHGVPRFVFASTGGAIYGEVPEGERADADAPAAPLSPYGCAKLAVEGYLGAYRHEHGLASTVLRYANVYGPRQDPHGEAGVVAIFCHRLLEGQPLQINARRETGDAGCVRDYVYVQDVVRANVSATEAALPASAPILNVGTGVGTSTGELAERLARAHGVEPPVRFAARRPGDLERSVLEPHPALGDKFTDISDGLARTLDWFRQTKG